MHDDSQTKAQILERVRPVLTKSYVLPLIHFTQRDWRDNSAIIIQRISESFTGTNALIVRSSAVGEDSRSSSCAGAYESIRDVLPDPAALKNAIETVFSSYESSRDVHRVLIQPQLANCRLSGVLFSREMTTLAPYRVFNYDDTSTSTSSVTSGFGERLRTYIRFCETQAAFPSPELKCVFDALDEWEAIFGERMEYELAVDAGGSVCLFQARPITDRPAAAEAPAPTVVADWLSKIAKKVAKRNFPHPHLHGARTIFGVMPDWNPAEIIGVKPRMLALSLYKELVTDSIWAYMRDNYGYRDLRSFPLLVSFLGVPYIDMRVSFNSFIPKGVKEALAEKLADYYLDRLAESPDAHDKIEFDIVFSCYYPGVRNEIRRLKSHGFTEADCREILSALRTLTNRIIHPEQGFWKSDLARIETLKLQQKRILDSSMPPIDKTYWLIEDCKRYGTLPFSGLARAGFIAVQFLKGFVRTGLWTRQEYSEYLASLNTVARRMGRDVRALHEGKMGREEFLAEYGHLRPGTYDILSARYDEDFDRYFPAHRGSNQPTAPAEGPFSLSSEHEERIAAMLRDEGLEVTPNELMTFIRAGIEGREYAKLVFTKSLSECLVQIESIGKRNGVTRDELSHLNIRTIQNLYSTLDAHHVREILLRDIRANQEAHRLTQIIKLPDLILSPEDAFHFHLGVGAPNFITLAKVRAEVSAEDDVARGDLSGKIVCIRSADPGYDWIFSQNIAGLITQFGGANSHMAIRAAEQSIPSVIGCGERNYGSWSSAQALEIDCASHLVRIIR